MVQVLFPALLNKNKIQIQNAVYLALRVEGDNIIQEQKLVKNEKPFTS